jgi:hypothetical protein
MPAGHFNVLKGAYPTLQQIDKSLPVATSETGIVRGSAMRIDTSGPAPAFIRTDATSASQGALNTPGPIVYFSLQDQAQPDVLRAGVITGIPCTFPAEVETDQYDSGGSFPVNGRIMAGASGKVVDHTDDKTAIGVVTAGPTFRWVNDAVAVAGERTGARVSVIKFQTIYAPNVSTA